MSSAPPKDPFVGRVVAERYRILAPLAKGGMGAVYRGEHVHMRKRVAIKVLHPETENLPELVSRFERESVVGANATHPNVATATDFGRDADGSYYLVTEYIEGITLKELLGRGPIDLPRASDIACQIARGLDAIHKLGIYHRDLNPRNVMVSEKPPDAVKLIDFGFAKVPIERFATGAKQGAALTAKGVVFGTIGYVAPESAFGMHAVSQPADLYALGVILYEMLTGEHPFDKSDQKELYRCHQMEPPPPFHERAPERHVPAQLEAVTMRLLEKSPKDRYASALDVIAAIERGLMANDVRPMSPSYDEEEDDSEPVVSRAPVSKAAVSKPASSRRGGPSSKPASSRPMRSMREESPRPAQLDVEPPPEAEPKRRGIPPHVWALAAVAAVLAVVAFVPGVRERILGGKGSEAASAAPADSPLNSSSNAGSAPDTTVDPSSGAPSTEPSGSAPAPTEKPTPERPTKIGDLDADGWRSMLRSAIVRSDAKKASESVLAIAAIDPGRFSDQALIADAAEAANLISQGDAAASKMLFDLLASADLEAAGPDILFRLVTLHGGSRGATRATELLATPEVLAHASPALRIAMDLRDAPCSQRAALLDRAAKEGDDRVYIMLMSMRAEGCQGCCLKNEPRLDAALRELRQRSNH